MITPIISPHFNMSLIGAASVKRTSYRRRGEKGDAQGGREREQDGAQGRTHYHAVGVVAYALFIQPSHLFISN